MVPLFYMTQRPIFPHLCYHRYLSVHPIVLESLIDFSSNIIQSEVHLMGSVTSVPSSLQPLHVEATTRSSQLVTQRLGDVVLHVPGRFITFGVGACHLLFQ